MRGRTRRGRDTFRKGMRVARGVEVERERGEGMRRRTGTYGFAQEVTGLGILKLVLGRAVEDADGLVGEGASAFGIKRTRGSAERREEEHAAWSQVLRALVSRAKDGRD